MTPLCLVWHFAFQNYFSLARGRLFLGTFPVKLLLKLCWEQLALFSFGLCVRTCLLASTRDVQIFTDVTVLVSLPACFTSGYWKVRCLFVMLFTTCYMMGGVGGCYLKAEIYLSLKFHYLFSFFQLLLRLGLFITNGKNNVCLCLVYIFCCTQTQVKCLPLLY